MINIFEPNITRHSIDLLNNVFESKWLGRGSYVANFEEKLAQTLKVRLENLNTIACCTDAIFGVFDILDIKPGKEIIIPSISFPAIGSAIISKGLRPKIVDIDLDSGNISLSSVENALSINTAAVFVTHYGGIPVDMKKLRALVGANIYLIEDAACALGTYVNGVACGTQGDFGCWSFDAMKLLTCGEGGAYYISSPEKSKIAKEYFYLGLPSQTKSGIDRQSTDSRWWEYQLNIPGRRSIFTNINAAIGLPQFDTLASSLQRRQHIRDYYCGMLDSVGVRYLRQDQSNVSYSNYFFTILSERRDALASYLKHNLIYSTFRYYPLHLISMFEEYANVCNEATSFSNTALNIPIHQSLTDSDVAKVAETIKNFYR